MKWKTYFFDTVDSTNTQARLYDVGSIVVAKKQTSGRGRYGRIWHSDIGNLYISFVVSQFGIQTPLLAFLFGVAVCEVLPEFSLRLKWPNDVLLNGGKLAGILLEQEDNKLIAGIGLNVTTAPHENMLYQTASLNGQITNEEVLKRLMKTVSDNMDLFIEKGFEPIREKWLKYGYGIGTQISVKLPNETLSGIFEELTPQGAISLKLNNGTRRLITVGDVFFDNKEMKEENK